MNLDQILKELGKKGDIPSPKNNELNVDNTEKEKRAEELYIEEYRYGIPLKEYEALEKIYNQIKPKEDFDTFYIKNSRINTKDGHVFRLYLNNTEVSDISSIEGLKNLKELNLNHTKVNDINPIKDLVNLEYLGLTHTKVNDISPVKGLVNLEELYLDGNTQVSDISPVKDLKNLKVLYLNNTSVSDISPISSLKNLNKLNLSETQVNDISPVKGLVNLGYLNLNHTKVNDISPVENLNLYCLNIKDSKVNPSDPIIAKLKKRGVYIEIVGSPQHFF